MHDDNQNRPFARMTAILREGALALALPAIVAAPALMQAQSAVPVMVPGNGQAPETARPQAWSYQNPPPAPGQVSPGEARQLMGDRSFQEGFNLGRNNSRPGFIQVGLPIWNNGEQYEYVKAASTYMRNFAAQVSVFAEQTTSTHGNSTGNNGALTGAAEAFTQQAEGIMDQLTVNWPFGALVARSGRDPRACAVAQRNGNPVYYPQNNTDPEAVRIRMMATADQALRLSVCLDESVPIGGFIGVGGKAGNWLANHHVNVGVAVQQPAAQGPQWTADLARRTTDAVNRLEASRTTLFNQVRAYSVLSGPEAAALWQQPIGQQLSRPSQGSAAPLPE